MKFGYEKITFEERDAYKLFCDNDSFLIVVPELGANVFRYIRKGTVIVDYSKKTLDAGGHTGCPMLYPTPNRVKDCKTVYRGKEYTQMKNGKEHILHGYVYDAPFEIEAIAADDTGAKIILSYEMKKGDEVLKSYPFENKLTLEISLLESSMKIEYKAENKSDAPMPYGFALHPYFYFKDDAVFTIPSDTYVKTTPQVIPTREFPKTEDAFPGINKGLKVSDCVLDNNFIKREGSENATLCLKEECLKIELRADEVFRHFVVYTPYGAKFICIENQTCAIDANNLYNEGFKKESGLLILAPGEVGHGAIEIAVSDM